MISLPQGPFPRIYRYSTFWRYVGLLFGGALFGGMIFLIYDVWALSPAELSGKIFLTAFSFFGMFMAYCMAGAAIRQRVILRDRSIEVVNLFGTRRIAYSDIAAKVRVPANYPMWALTSAQGDKPVKFDMGYAFDQSFSDWFAAVPEGELKLLARHRR
jgi:hypothetical protein